MFNLTLVGIGLSVAIVWLVVTNILLWQLISRYRKLTEGITKKELRELLENASKKLDKQKKATDQLQAWLKKLETHEESHLQKVGFVRFNPFIDTGGDQSFCLALLDRHNNGIVISSLHSRDQTRIYAKSIRGGKAEGQELSKEEQEAIKKAQESQDSNLREAIKEKNIARQGRF